MRYYVRDGEDPIYRDHGIGIHLFGQVASTGEYVQGAPEGHSVTRRPSASTGSSTRSAPSAAAAAGAVHDGERCRASDTYSHSQWMGLAIGGVVYLLIVAVYFAVKNPGVQRDWIYPFDLETEKWLPNIKGPPQGFFFFIDTLNL
jgi:hypothetical protein